MSEKKRNCVFYGNNMKEKMLKNKYTLLFIINLLLIFLLMYNITRYVTLALDDYSYIMSDGNIITNLNEIIEFQLNHYFGWGGRSVTHTIAQLFFINDFQVYYILNSLAFLVTILAIYLNVTGKFEVNNKLLMLITCAFCIFQPVFWETNLWITGSANYMWGGMLVLLAILPFRFYVETKKESKETNKILLVLVNIFAFIGSILAGWTNENTAAAMLVIMVLYYIYIKFIEKKKITSWMWSIFIGGCIGFAFMILAPGNFLRSSLFEDSAGIIKYIERLGTCFELLKGSGFLYVIGILSLGLIFQKFPKERNDVNICWIYAIAAIVSVLVMLLSPYFPRRALYGTICFMTIVLGIIFKNINLDNKILKIVCNICFCGLIFLTGIIYVYSVDEMKESYNEYILRDKYIKEQISLGEMDIIVNTSIFPANGIITKSATDISEDSSNWINSSLSRYYGINSIKLEK